MKKKIKITKATVNAFPKAILLAVLMVTITAPLAAGEIGLQMYSLRHQLAEDAPAAIKQVADWGIAVVEGGGMQGDLTVAEFRQALRDNEVQVVSVDTSFEELRDNPLAVVYKADYFGAKYATFYWIPHDGSRTFGFEDAHKAVEVMNEAGAILAKNGITLQYHPHGYEFTPHEDGTLLDYIITATENAEFQMDVYWIKQGGGDPVAILKQYEGRFKSLHLKDRAHGTPNSSNGHADVETNVVLGTGDVGIADVVAEAKKQGIKYFFIEDESSRVIQQVPQSMEFLNGLEP